MSIKYANLYEWGFCEYFEREAQLYDNLSPARITEQHQRIYNVVCVNGFLQATVAGKFVYNADSPSCFPAVGDWVMVRIENGAAVIHQTLARKSVFGRKVAGTSQEAQIVASNIDKVFICMALQADYNLRRLERYLSIAWDSGAIPVIVLTKSDLCENLPQRLEEIVGISLGVDTIVCSNLTQDGYDSVQSHIQPGKTIAFIGSSGVGKSTLINHLLGTNALATKELRNNDKGRHTTTSRQLMLLPGGGLVIDTPGMRELGIISVDLAKSFADIEDLAVHCRFKNCSHESEPGCAVRAAIEDGILEKIRLESYKKIQVEAAYSGLSSKQIEEEKIKRMFGGKSEMSRMIKDIKTKNSQR